MQRRRSPRSDQPLCRARRPRRNHARQGRLAHNAQAARAIQHQSCALDARQPGTQPDRERLAVPASRLSLKSSIPRLPRCRRSLQLSLEQAHRRAWPHRLNRQPNLDRNQSRSVKIGISRRASLSPKVGTLLSPIVAIRGGGCSPRSKS
jgi:hypothetical protein